MTLGKASILMSQKIVSAAQLRAARAMLNLKQEEVARASAVARPTITEIESGRRVPQARTLIDLVRSTRVAGSNLSRKPTAPGRGLGSPCRSVTPQMRGRASRLCHSDQAVAGPK